MLQFASIMICPFRFECGPLSSDFLEEEDGLLTDRSRQVRMSQECNLRNFVLSHEKGDGQQCLAPVESNGKFKTFGRINAHDLSRCLQETDLVFLKTPINQAVYLPEKRFQ